jgi:hypothetical protein
MFSQNIQNEALCHIVTVNIVHMNCRYLKYIQIIRILLFWDFILHQCVIIFWRSEGRVEISFKAKSYPRRLEPSRATPIVRPQSSIFSSERPATLLTLPTPLILKHHINTVGVTSSLRNIFHSPQEQLKYNKLHYNSETTYWLQYWLELPRIKKKIVFSCRYKVFYFFSSCCVLI